MTTKLIERYVIRDSNNVIIASVEDITTPADPTLRVEDRKTTNVIATINNNDSD